MTGLLILCLLIGFYCCIYFYDRWNLYHRPVKEMSEKTLKKVEDAWLQRYAFRGHSEIFHVRRKYAKKDGDESKMIVAYKRILEVQEELLARQKASNESWQIDYIDRLKSKILLTREMLGSHERFKKIGTPTINHETPKPIVDLKESAKQPIDFNQSNQSKVGEQKTIAQLKKPPKKSNKSLFIESFGNYLWSIGTSSVVHSAVMNYIKHPKLISSSSENVKQNIVSKIFNYQEQASQEELEMFNSILTKLIGALKNQVQHFSEKMLHGKNIQTVEC